MKKFTFISLLLISLVKVGGTKNVPEHFRHVDQVIWVVDDLNHVVAKWKELGFQQIESFGSLTALNDNGKKIKISMAVANLGGAQIVWIEPHSGKSVFSSFKKSYGEGAMSLVHKLKSESELEGELNRLSGLGVKVLDKLTIATPKGNLTVTLMDTRSKGKYVLGYVTIETSDDIHAGLTTQNRHHMKLNQYAFAINDTKDISKFWSDIGFPEFQISHPDLGETKYYGKIVDHKLIQGWQRHGDIAYEWCIPVKGPIVYADHIDMHGEGIHHLAYSVENMDEILEEYESLGYKNTMGGTWGEEGKPGSGRYEYVGLEEAGGMTMELLWNYKEN